MKKCIFIIIALFFYSFSFGQNKVEKYCFLLVDFSNIHSQNSKVNLHIFLGTDSTLFSFKDTSVMTKLKKVEQMTTIPDAFNYLGSINWTFVYPLSIVNSAAFGKAVPSGQYCFKRTFDETELDEQIK